MQNEIIQNVAILMNEQTENYAELKATTEDLSRALIAGDPVKIGPTEFRLLERLMRYPGRVYSREQLLDKVWGNDVYVEVRTVDVHVGRLRRKLESFAGRPIIFTSRGEGYIFGPTTELDDSGS